MVTLTERGRRVALHLPVEVVGQDVRGRPFSERTRSLNVSGGGICFESRRRLQIGARLKLNIALPPALRRRFAQRATYRVRCVVCRVEAPEGASSARVGARFLGEIAA